MQTSTTERANKTTRTADEEKTNEPAAGRSGSVQPPGAGPCSAFTLVETVVGVALMLIFTVSFISLLSQHASMQLHALTYYKAAALAKSTLESSVIRAYDDLPSLADSNRVDGSGTPSSTGEFLRVVAVDSDYGATLSPSTELTRISVAVTYKFHGSFREPLVVETIRWRD